MDKKLVMKKQPNSFLLVLLIIFLSTFYLLLSTSFVYADFAVKGATVTFNNNVSFRVAGSSGSIKINSVLNCSSAKIFLSGNWENSGKFTAGTSTVAFENSATTSTLVGNTTFYNFVCETPGKTIIFTTGSYQTVGNLFTLTGATGNLIKLRSSIAGNKWSISFPNGSQTVNYVDVKDSNALYNTVTANNSINSGNNNANWIFPVLTGTISGKVTKSADGTAISGALIELLSAQGGLVASSTTSDTSGNYSITIATGTYDVRANASGYQTKTVFSQSAVSGQVTTVDFALSEVYTGPVEKLWTRQLGTSASDSGFWVAVDTAGNIYVTGFTMGGLDGNTNQGGSDQFLVKYDANGNKIWTRQIGTSANENAHGRAEAVAVDSAGNIYITGWTYGSLDGNVNAGSADIFLVKYDSSGNKLWTRQLGSSGEDGSYGVATDSVGNIYVTGETYGTLPGQTSAGATDIFLVKYDSLGNKIWTKQLGTSAHDQARGGVAIDSTGNVYISGYSEGGLDGNTNAGGQDIFLVKYDSSGNKIWTKQLGTSANDVGFGAEVDPAGNIYVTGATLGGLDGNTNQGSWDIFLIKYDSSGNKIWTKQLGTSAWDYAYGVATDSSGNIYLTGFTYGGLDGNTNQGGVDIFLVKYDQNGNKIWTKQLGTSSDDLGQGVATDSSDNLYVTGYTYGSLDGNINQGDSDIFLVKFGPSVATTGSIAGKVTKSDGVTAIQGTLIELLSAQGGLVASSTTSDTSGNYSITIVTGTYDVRATASGYQTQTKTGYTVTAGTTTIVNFALGETSSILQGLVGCWKFEESSGTTATDSSGNGNNGTIYGATYVDGRIGKALSFDGINDEINVPDSLSLQSSTISVSFWFWNDSNKEGFFLDKDITGTGTNDWNIFHSTDGRISFGIGTGGSNYSLATPSGWNNSAWHHIVCLRRNSDGYTGIYVDSVLRSSATYPAGAIGGVGQNLRIGAGQPGWPSSMRYFKGKIDEVRFYSRVLSGDEILTLYQSTSVVADVGTISGKVTKSDGTTAIQGALVELLSAQGGLVASSTTTASDGTYQLINLSTGTYDVRASASGYVTKTSTGIVVIAGSAATVNFALLEITDRISDNFDRADSSTVGNGWSEFESQGDIKIYWNRLYFAATGTYNYGFIYQQLYGYLGEVGISADLTEGNGYYSNENDRFNHWFLLKSSPTAVVNLANPPATDLAPSSGYGLKFARSSSLYNNSMVQRYDNGTKVDSINSSFQFSGTLRISATFYANGSIEGRIYEIETGNSFSFSFGTRSVLASGNNLMCGITEEGLRSNTTPDVPEPTIDNLRVNYIPAIFQQMGTISGKVTKSDGSTPIQGALVELLRSGVIKSSTTTATDGTYQLVNLSTGTYEVRCQVTGYKLQVTTGVVVVAGQTTTVNFALSEVARNWASVSAGWSYTLAIKTDGTLWAWGYNYYGQLGLGDETNRNAPIQVGTDTNWASVSAGSGHTLAMKTDGTLWAWGRNYYGQLGLGDTTDRNTPTRVGTLTNWASVSAGSYHALAIKTDGTLWAWGYNEAGRLGLADTTNRNTPTKVGTATNWASVSAGAWHTLAIKTDGTLWAWGDNGNGQLGLGDTTDRNTPTRVGTLTNWASVSAGGGSHTLAMKTDGTLWAWGSNGSGQLGLGDTTDRNTPTRVGTLTNWASVFAGGSHTLAMKTDGTLWAWGSNGSGQLGLGDTTDRNTPTRVGTLTNWASVSGGGLHTLARKTDGTLWAWGYNEWGQLGLGDTTDRWTPTQVGEAPPPTTGSISGKVTKSDGATAIQGALVELLRSGVIASSTTTDTSGNYSITIVTGTYEMRATASGYLPNQKSNVVVTAGQITTVNFTLIPLGTETYSFETKWGSYGSANGQFNSPLGITVDSSSNVYVVDRNNFRIQKFNSNGTYITKWGSYGTTAGYFNSPYGITSDSSNNLYVADTNNHWIQKFNANGTYLSKFGSYGTADGYFSGPRGVAVDSSGNIYVADMNNHRIQKFSPTGTFTLKWGSYGTGNGQFYYPQSVAVDSSGNVYIADRDNHRIQKFTSTGTFVTKWGSQGSANGQFKYPAGIAVDSYGNVYVAERDNYRIQKFNSNGTFLTKIGSYGSGDGQFSSPEGVTVDASGSVYVADTGSNRVQKFKAGGWISGRVTVSGSTVPVKGALVEATRTDTGYQIASSTTTDTNGNYLMQVPAGTYKVWVTAGGYAPAEKTNITVLASQTTTVDFALVLLRPLSGTRFTLYNNLFDPTQGERVIVTYELTENTEVRIMIYDFRGNLVKSLVSSYKTAGIYTETWDGKNEDDVIVASGIYLIQIKAGSFKETKKAAVVE